MIPDRFRTPRRTSIRPTDNSIERPILGGITRPKRMIAEPTAEFAAGPNQALPTPGMSLDQWEKSLLERALLESGGNQTRAAQRLGISRDTLRYRLKKHGIGG
jgi:DNA-binding NtrC family response regulator